MSRRTLRFIVDPDEAGAPEAGADVVVLDTAWTPLPGARPDVRPVRPVLQDVVARVDLFDGSLDRLDDWADAARLADHFVMHGVTWWYRVRMLVRWELHERMLWRHVLDELSAKQPYDQIVIPKSRRALVDAARASRAGAKPVKVVIIDDLPSSQEAGRLAARTARVRALPRRALRLARRVLRRALRRPPAASDKKYLAQLRARELATRVALLDQRIDDAIEASGGVLAIASSNFFQKLQDGTTTRFVDPHLALVLDRLAVEGTPVLTVALALSHRNDDAWVRIEADDRILPDSMVKVRWAEDDDAALDADDLVDGLAAVAGHPIDVAGWDLGPAMLAIVMEQSRTFLGGQRRWTTWAERLLRDLRPGVLLIDHEGVRTVWLAAARRLGIPVVSVQHGVIYPNNPEYCHPVHIGLVRPDLTCVFGPYERDVLIDEGQYPPDQVVVTGSSRSDPDAAVIPTSPSERDDVRRELGVREGDTMVVVSVAHNPVMGDVHSVCMVERLFGGPLPGVHLVFKLHPQEKGRGPYERLLRGLALAGGYEAPAMTSVRDFDLFRLLRSTDVHVGQYSTVNTDAVVAGTPSLLAVGQAYADMLGYVDAGVAVPVRDVEEVRRAIAARPTLDPDARARFLAAHFEPGDATARIIAGMRGLRRTPAVDLRRVTADDAELLRTWANDPVTRAAGFHPDVIGAETHRAWLADRLGSATTRLYLGLAGTRPIGQVRLEVGGDGVAEVGIAIAPESRGRGLGHALLAAALLAGRSESALGIRRYVAHVRTDNDASIGLFTSAGFEAGPPVTCDGVPCLRFERGA